MALGKMFERHHQPRRFYLFVVQKYCSLFIFPNQQQRQNTEMDTLIWAIYRNIHSVPPKCNVH